MAAWLACGSTAWSEEAQIGRKIGNFSLRDYRGKEHNLSDYADSKAVVVAFLGTDCPLVKLYSPRLEELSNEYEAKGVTFLAINSNLQDNLAKIASHARTYNMTFPILKDGNHAVADLFGAVRTPEVFVLDQDRVIRYWGRIDDQYGLGTSSGYARPEVNRRDLALALDEVLSGKEVSVATTKALGCLIGRSSQVTPHGEVTYSNQIARVFQNRCVECHRPNQIGPFPLTNYDEVVGWAPMIKEVVSEGRMPPWFADPKFGHFSNDTRMSDEDRELLFTWIDNGCPQGDPQDLPEPRVFAENWQIPEPDEVFYMSEEPFTVAAEGTVDYQYFTVDPGWKEDKWIAAAEAKPGNRAVVHHIIVFVEKPGERGGERAGGASIGFAPGMPARAFPPGYAMFVPAGSKFRFQMHYTANGTEQQDLSCVGFKFADPESVHKRINGGVTGNVTFKIPPHDPNYEIRSKKKVRKDTLLLSMLPHMHLRGKSFRYEVAYPDGTKEVLLDIPKYDFNWQMWYQLAEPKLIPKGSVIHCTAAFDNSADNVANPDPSQTVTWGEQTWEEMMFGFMTTADPKEDLNPLESSDPKDEDYIPADKIGL